MKRQNLEKAPPWLRNAKKLAMTEWKKNHEYQRNAVYLADPVAEDQIDEIITSDIWPAALRALGDTHFRILGGEKPQIEREWYIRACHSVNIVVEDPKRPFIAGAFPPWYARLNIRCTISGPGLFQDYLSLNLPMGTPFPVIVDILTETDWGNPPTLSVSHVREDNKPLHIVFENGGPGNGANQWLAPGERIERKLRAYCDFIDVACEIENEPGEPLLFRKLVREVSNVFEI